MLPPLIRYLLLKQPPRNFQNWFHRDSNVELICITGPPAHGLDKVIWNAALRRCRSGPNAKTVASKLPGIPAPCNTDWMKEDRRERVKGRPWSPTGDQMRALKDVNMPGWPKLDRARPRYMKHPWGNRSFLELLMHMQRLEGLTSTSTCKSWTVKWMDGSKVRLTINSPALRNPKKPRQQAAHSMTCSELWVSKECWIIRMVGCHWLALCESWALVALNAPERALKLEAVHQGIG